MRYDILTVDGNPKVAKGAKRGYLTGVLHFAPAGVSGFNVCPWSTPECRADCLHVSGRGAIPNRKPTIVDGITFPNVIQAARYRRTRLFLTDRAAFWRAVVKDIKRLVRDAEARGLRPSVRMNGTSDILWERVEVNVDGITAPNIMAMFPKVTFYDYTKAPATTRASLPRNYSLTFSRGELTADATVLEHVTAGRNVAVVFNTKRGRPLPSRYLGARVIDGDVTDLRFRDPRGVVVGLRAKGKARRRVGGFVVDAS